MGTASSGRPSRLRSGRPFGPDLVERLEQEVDFLPVVRTAVIDLGVTPPARAMVALDGFLQWFSVVPISDRVSHYVMLRGDVDRVWHAAILNTALYRELCTQHAGRYVDHHPSADCPRVAWVLDTVGLLESVFGAALHPAFSQWREQALGDANHAGPDALVRMGLDSPE